MTNSLMVEMFLVQCLDSALQCSRDERYELDKTFGRGEHLGYLERRYAKTRIPLGNKFIHKFICPRKSKKLRQETPPWAPQDSCSHEAGLMQQ